MCWLTVYRRQWLSNKTGLSATLPQDSTGRTYLHGDTCSHKREKVCKLQGWKVASVLLSIPLPFIFCSLLNRWGSMITWHCVPRSDCRRSIMHTKWVVPFRLSKVHSYSSGQDILCCYGTRSFSTVFRWARQRALPWARWIHTLIPSL
jgi:hypothetical protein